MNASGHSQSLLEFLTSRRSVRRFEPRPVDDGLVARLIETATRAPNAHNRQPWRFVRLKSAASRERLAGAMAPDFRRALQDGGLAQEEIELRVARSKTRITEAPEGILLCLKKDLLDEYTDENRSRGEYLMGVQGVALAGGQLLLAAHAEGLGGVWVCAPLFVPAEVAAALDLPASWEAQGLLLLGYPAKEVDPRARQPVDEVLVNR